MVSCYRLLGDRFFTLKVRSLSGKDVPVSLYQMNVILCPDKKGKGPKTQLSPSRVSVLAKRRQISVGSSLRARFPDSAQLSSLKEPGTQPNQLLGSSGRPERGEIRSHKLGPRQTTTAIWPQRQGWGEVHCCLKAWAKAS